MRKITVAGILCLMLLGAGLWIAAALSSDSQAEKLEIASAPHSAHSSPKGETPLGATAHSQPSAVLEPSSVMSYGAAADPIQRAELAARFRSRSQAAREAAHAAAEAAGIPVRGKTEEGQTFALMRLSSGNLPIYNYTRATSGAPQSRNFHAGISSHAEAIRERPPFMNRTGNGLLLGVWDGGPVLTNHIEFLLEGGVSRIILGDADEQSEPIEWDDHGTHVGGTMVAAGVNPRARGMAPSSFLRSYDWDDDVAEWIEVANATATNQSVVTSNHSYGPTPSWGRQTDEEGNPIIVWIGIVNEHDGESLFFGQYDLVCHDFDAASYAAPYTLAFFAAGNERTNSPAFFGLEEGDTYYVYEDNEGEFELVPVTFDPADPNLPKNTDFKFGGMNTLSGVAVAKNVMSVGAVHPAYTRTARSPARAQMTDFSTWGPTDDGRIKPDIVSDGVNLLSVSHDDPEGYRPETGTSMASPAAAGTAALLQDLYVSWFDEFMSAALLKGLIIHTATDLGRPGPDYVYGWGLIDGQAAAEVIHEYFLTPDRLALNEGVLENAATNEYRVIWDGVSPLSATLTWTDPPPDEELVESIEDELNPTDLMLVHDLDLRIIGPDETVYMPWILDPAQPTNNATKGDNFRDNVERVDLAPTQPGEYRILISHKGELDPNQPYGLVITGQRMTDGPRLKMYQQQGESEYRIGQGGSWFAGVTKDLASMTLTGRIVNTGAATLHFHGGMQVKGDAALTVTTPPASSILPGESSLFEITYQPTTYGQVSAQVEISHSETYQSPFFFRLTASSQETISGWPEGSVDFLSITQHVNQAGVVADIAVTLGLEAEYLEDVKVSLVSPSGITNVVLYIWDREDVDLSGLTFTDRAATSDWTENPAPGNEFRWITMPVQGEFEAAGDWVLRIENHPGVIPDNFALTQFELAVDWVTPQIAFVLDQVFRESSADDGSIANGIGLVVIGDTFTEQAADYVTVHNVPAGLTPVVELFGSTLIIDLHGQAEHHNRFNSTANLRIEIGDGAFENLTAADIRGLPVQGVMIDFIGDDGDLYVTTAPVAVPIQWLTANSVTSSFHAAVLLDQNKNGYAAWQHYVMDTDPAVAGSELAFAADTQLVEAGIQLRWWGSSNRLYRILGATNLVEGLNQTIGDSIQPAATGWQTIIDTNLNHAIQAYGIEVQLP